MKNRRKILFSIFYFPRSRKGFTLIELLIFSAIFSLIMVAFIAILVSVTKVQTRQYALAEVNGQSQFILQTIERLVAQSSVVDMTAGESSSTLKLRMAASSSDPTYIYLSSGTVYLKETDSGQAQALTTSRVTVSSLDFTRRSNSPGRDSVSVAFTVEYTTPTASQKLPQSLSTTIARVSAATFDSNLIPSSTATYNLGITGQVWSSVNNIVNFSGSNVGIGTASPGQTLEVNGGLRLNTATAQPTCDTSQRGTFWVTESASGTKDYVDVCVKNASNTYLWAPIY